MTLTSATFRCVAWSLPEGTWAEMFSEFRPRAFAGMMAVAMGLTPALVHADDLLRKGPWLMDLRATSLVVMAERAVSGPLRVVAVPLGAAMDSGGEPAVHASSLPAEVSVTDAAVCRLHEVRLEGLSPGTRYRYVVAGPGVLPTGGVFTMPPNTDVPFRFVVYGDTRSERVTHRAIIEAASREGADFAVHTGDLVADGRSERAWQDFFSIEEPLLRNTPLVPVIGNHEIVHPLSSGTSNFQRYIHVDPTGPTPELDYTFRFANARFVLANAYDDWTGPARTWLSNELSRARWEAPDAWLFVVMHWGPRSSGPHGDNYLFHDAGIDQLLKQYRVDLVISGHDHEYERGDDGGLRYVVSGGGGAGLYRRMHPHASSRVFASEHHYVRIDVERDKLTLSAMRLDGTELDHAILRHTGWDDTPGRPCHDSARPRLTSAGGDARWSDAALGLSRMASGVLVAATALLALFRLRRLAR